MIYVTHDQVEAMTLGDRIVVMNKGHVQQIDTPLDLYEQPANRFVAGFIGSPAMNFANGTIEGGGPSRFVAEGGEWEINLPDARHCAARISAWTGDHDGDQAGGRVGGCGSACCSCHSNGATRSR